MFRSTATFCEGRVAPDSIYGLTMHADEVYGRCFVDAFSCKPFDADLAAAIAVAHFGGTPRVRVIDR
jgi:hypothetical protein